MLSSRRVRSALALVFALVPSLALACGWDGSIEEPTFFDALAFVRPGHHPFLYAATSRFHERSAPPSDQNVDEWLRFFDGKLDREAWSQLLYRDDLKRLDALINQLKGKQDAKAAAKDRAFFTFSERDRLVAALMYVGFAKRVEPIALAARPADAWSDPVAVDRKAQFPTIDKLFTAGSRQAEAERDPFLRQRYAFQLLRLQFYRGEHAKVVELSERWRTELAQPGVIAARALCTLGGSVRRLGDVPRSNLLFARAFDASDDTKELAALGAKLDDEKTLAATLALASTPRERAVTWALLGSRGSELRAIKEVSALEPGSDLLPLLLARAVVKAEVNAEGDPPERRAKALAPLADWLRAEAGKQRPAPFLLQLSLAHVEAAAQDARALPHALEAAKRAPTDAASQAQAHVTTLFAALSSPGALDEALLVREATPVLAGQKRTPFSGWVRGRLAERWAKRDLVLSTVFSGVARGTDADLLLKVKAFLAKPDKSPLEQLAESAWLDDSLDRRIAVAFMAQGDAARAAPGFASDSAVLQADPFLLHARDCLECDLSRPGKKTATRAQVLARMAALQRSGKPADLVQLGTALYNSTEWGNACLGLHEFNQDLFRATAQVARKAMETSDREVKARAALLLAKAELQQFYETPAHAPLSVDFRPGDGFRALATLEDTKFAREVLAECGHYRTFRGR